MNILKIIYLLFFVIVTFGIAGVSYADEPLHSFKDYLIIMVHGNGADYKTWVGKPNEKDFDGKSKDKLFEYLNSIGCSQNVFVYSFSDPFQYIKQEIVELGRPTSNIYESSSKIDDKFEVFNKRCWIDQAKYDYAKRIADADPDDDYNSAQKVLDLHPEWIPQKVLFITHSMGNFAVRGYIMSDELANQGFWGNDIKEGFYRGDVDKVVFIDSVLNGSETPMFVFLNLWRTNATIILEMVQGILGNQRAADKSNLASNMNVDGLKSGADFLLQMGTDAYQVAMAGIIAKTMSGDRLSNEEAALVGILLNLSNAIVVQKAAGLVDNTLNLSMNFTPFIDYATKLGDIVNPAEAYFNEIKAGTDIASSQLAKDFIGLFLSYGFGITMFKPTIHGEYSGVMDPGSVFRGIDEWDDTLYEKGMAKTLKNITIRDINNRYGKDYKNIKYSAIITDGSFECNAERTRVATLADMAGKGGKTFGVDLTNTIGFMGLKLGTDSAYTMATITDPEFWSIKSTTAKLVSLLASNYGTVMSKSGDFCVSVGSQKGEGISEFGNMKRFYQTVYPEKMERYLNENLVVQISGIESVIFAMRIWAPQPPIVYGCLRMIPPIALAQKLIEQKDEIMDKIVSHFYAPGSPNLPLITQALYEPPSIKIDGMYLELKGNEIEAYNLPTPSTLAQRVTLAPAPANNSEEGRAKWPNYVLVSTTNIPIPYGRAGGTPPQLIALQDTYYARITTFAYTEGASGSDTIQIYHPQENKVVWAANLAQQPSISSTIL